MCINWFSWIIFFIIVYVIQKIRGNENSQNYLNVMVNYHYHFENRLITFQFPSMLLSRSHMQKTSFTKIIPPNDLPESV